MNLLKKNLNIVWIQIKIPNAVCQPCFFWVKSSEWSQTIRKYTFSDKNDKFRQNWPLFGLNFQQMFGCWIQQICFGVKLPEFSKEFSSLSWILAADLLVISEGRVLMLIGMPDWHEHFAPKCVDCEVFPLLGVQGWLSNAKICVPNDHPKWAPCFPSSLVSFYGQLVAIVRIELFSTPLTRLQIVLKITKTKWLPPWYQ